MPELVITLDAVYKNDYESKKFFAALQGVDLDKNNNQGAEVWQKALAKAQSNNMTDNPNDILTLQDGSGKLSLTGDTWFDYEGAF